MTKITRQHILVTGANGFICRNLCPVLKEKGYYVRGAVRGEAHDVSGADEYIKVGNINESTDWQQTLDGVDTVIHLAARVHVISDLSDTSVEIFRKINVRGTERLALSAAKAGVRRFIFISSIGVNGDSSQNKTFTEDSIPNPVGAYAVSKWEAENVLKKIGDSTGMEIVILRPPLIYGPGVKANFKNLIKLAGSGMPLPFKKINNLRSFLYIGNLIDIIDICIKHPMAIGETFIISDGQDISTPDLIKMISCIMGKKSSLFYLHPGILKALCKIVGLETELRKLTGSLLVDSSKIRNLLGWKPPFTMEDGLRETVKNFKAK